MATPAEPVRQPGKNQFKCFNCREIFAMKEGEWHVWKTMEVHLCKKCNTLTKDRPERKSSNGR